MGYNRLDGYDDDDDDGERCNGDREKDRWHGKGKGRGTMGILSINSPDFFKDYQGVHLHTCFP